MNITLIDQVSITCRYLLSEINRDPVSSSCGCFDRRYWAWKLTDFPEATFQRNLFGLSWLYRQQESEFQAHNLIKNIKSGLEFALKIQHRDGSFDQAYPHEHSYGATGFLLPDLISSYQTIYSECSASEVEHFGSCLYKAAEFLTNYSEQHSFIANHLAGAALGLFKASELLNEKRFSDRGQSLLNLILKNQSSEGWFPEYGGADPGYQTLCMHYLAQIYMINPSPELNRALAKSLGFLKYFVHPNGTFGGEYGSRRTEIYYPGGIALLAGEFPDAACLHQYMLSSIEAGRTSTLVDMDMGNTAPLLNSYILAMDAEMNGSSSFPLPFQESEVSKDFPISGLAVRSRKDFYLILGSSNGGVLKIYDKKDNHLVLDDCGALGIFDGGRKITSQSTQLNNKIHTSEDKLECVSSFYPVNDTLPNPFNYLMLRLMNLTLMRISFFNETLKKLMVRALVKNSKRIGMSRTRKVELKSQAIEITDTFRKSTKTQLTGLSQGYKFTSIHMASARYFSPAQAEPLETLILDHGELNKKGTLISYQQIAFRNPQGRRSR